MTIPIADVSPSENTLAILQHYEQGPKGGHAAVPYKCSAGKSTIGFGHVILPGEKFPNPLTLDDAVDLLYEDVDKFDEGVRALLIKRGVKTIEQHQYDALVCLAYNIGIGKYDGVPGDFADSTLLKHFCSGAMRLAAAEFHKWVYARVNGVSTALAGLIRRRKSEAYLFQWGEVSFFLKG